MCCIPVALSNDYGGRGRSLADGSVAVVAVNNGEEPRTITCDGACFAQSNFSATEKLLVRDLWQHKELGSVSGSIVFKDVPPNAGSVVLTLRRAAASRLKADEGPARPAAPPKHILFFVIDDYGFADASYKNAMYPQAAAPPTPTIDKLAMSGVRLESYYVHSLCS